MMRDASEHVEMGWGAVGGVMATSAIDGARDTCCFESPEFVPRCFESP